ncbi:MAG: Gx transporter family protein [Oscillospiraceae bacterium]|nr:Gx transporter family protein [Oscillospiraceae bacterium]
MKTKKIALLGIISALTFSLSALDSVISAPLPLGVRIGVANIVVMLTILTVGKKEGFIITLLKSLFILVTKGITASLLSLSGGILAFLITILLLKSEKNSLILISVLSALTHNVGQIIMASVIMKNINTLFYLPVLIVSAIITGTITGSVIKAVMPLAEKAVKKTVKEE